MGVNYPQPEIRQLGTSKRWELTEDFDIDLDGRSWHFRKGFVYDRATIPEVVPPWLVNKDDLGSLAPLIHDALCRYKGRLPATQDHQVSINPWRRYTNGQTDRLFRAILVAQGVPSWRAWLAWYAVAANNPVSKWP